jgi:hypothetical protein
LEDQIASLESNKDLLIVVDFKENVALNQGPKQVTKL